MLQNDAQHSLIAAKDNALRLYAVINEKNEDKSKTLYVSQQLKYKASIKHIKLHDLYTIYVAGPGIHACIGLYATKIAAYRVANLITKYDSVRNYAHSLYEITTTEPAQQLQIHSCNKLKINEPIGKPKENVSFHKKTGRLKIKTPKNCGYTDKCVNIYQAYALRDAILCSGSLENYIKTQKT